jgi:hypothetical protein
MVYLINFMSGDTIGINKEGFLELLKIAYVMARSITLLYLKDNKLIMYVD